MAVLRAGVLFVLVCLLLGPCYGEKDVVQVRQEEREDVPLDFLFLSGNDNIETMIGFEIIEFVHNEHMKCDIRNRKEELKFGSKMEEMRRYYRQAKQTISQPDFEELSRENRKDLETNFRKAFKDIEVNHLKKLSHLQMSCDKSVDMFMADKLKEVLQYVSTLLQRDPVQFAQLLFDIAAYRDQLQYGLNSCMAYLDSNSEREHFEQAGNLFQLCYGPEVLLLVRFIANITEQADKMSSEKFHWVSEKVVRIDTPTESPLPDQEDGDDIDDYDDESSGEEPSVQDQRESVTKTTPTTSSATPTKPKKPTKLDKVDEFVNSLQPGPVIIVLGNKDTPTTKKPPHETGGTTQEGKEEKEPTKEPTKSKEATPTLSKEDLLGKIVDSFEPGIVLPEDKSKGEPVKMTDPTTATKSTAEVLDKFSNLIQPGPVIIESTDKSVTTTTEPTEEYPGWVKDEYNDIKKMQETASQEEESPETRSRSESKSSEEEEEDDESDESHFSLDLDLPGVDAGVDIEIGADGVKIDGQAVEVGGSDTLVFDDVTTTAQETPFDESQEFKTYFFIYFFGTLGVLLAITIVVLVILIVRVKMCRRGQYKKDTPLISEEETIAEMKQSGYVNPTYRFFDQAKDV